ncbi:PadR family transcriptional regulator [Pseudooceanicola sp. LIPI14-2-Ac024]|uniref:PadR family transcriptional regulator n=1 Tax=Pseudooceanicola sp. LIPI14-2-Ac024 TaxID=3344875 RepID=UPI0035D0AFB3
MRHDTSTGRGRPHGPHHHRHGRGRGRRPFDYGELRLLILAMIVEKPRHGYELIKEISDRFEGRYTPSPGVIYPTLSWLEDVGYVTIAADGGGRKLSTVTEEGRAFLAANRNAVDEVLSRTFHPRPDIPPQIEAAMDALKQALRDRLEAAPSPDAVAAMAAAITDAARAVAGPTPSQD